MSAYDDLQMLFKAGNDPKVIKDPWALGTWLARTKGKHTPAEYARALEDKRDAKEWNPVSSEWRAKDDKKKAKKTEDKEAAAPKKERAAPGTKKYGSPGRQSRMKLSLDESMEILNLLKAKMDEEKPKIKEDDKDEHEDKEPIKDPFAVATWRTEREGHDLSTDEGKERRKEIVEDIKAEGNVVGEQDEKDEDVKKAMPIQKISASLAGLMAAAAGWAMSDDIVRSGGGSPRGDMTPQQVRDWERTVRRSMRKNNTALDKASWDALQKTYYDDSDLYFRKVPVQNAVVISKDHAPIPPRQGLQWDELKKKWVSADHLGRSASELQGKKRIRGSGTGVHEHALRVGGAGGKGVGSGVAGRRFRGVADAGVMKPHESKHVSGYKRGGAGGRAAKVQASNTRMAERAKARPQTHKRQDVRGGHLARMAALMKPMAETKGPAIKT